MLNFMRQRDKQRNNEVMGQCSPAELMDKPLTHGSHLPIHPASQFLAFVAFQLYKPHPVTRSPGLTVPVGSWLTGVTGEIVLKLRACLMWLYFKDTKWKEKGRTFVIQSPRRNYIMLSVWDMGWALQLSVSLPFKSCHLTTTVHRCVVL